MNELALVTWRLPQTTLPRLERAREAVQDAEESPDIFTLTTCQRALACTVGDEPSQAATRLAENLDAPGGEQLTSWHALRHLARVAASLEALVPGEDQVPAQFRQALHDQGDALATPVRRQLERVRALSRKARDAGELAGHQSRSLIDLVLPLVPDRGSCAVVGTGTIADEALRRLSGSHELHVVSRSRNRARERAGSPQRAWTREAFFDQPPRLEVLLLATRNNEEVVLPPEKARRVADAGNGELVVVDLGVPRNAAPAVRRLDGLRVHDLEALARVARNRRADSARIQQTHQALEDALARERRRRSLQSRKQRIVALREELATEVQALAAQLPEPVGEDDLEAWRRQAHGRLAHVSQRHLEAALEGDDPP